MKRRDFLRTSAGLLATLQAGYIWAVENPMSQAKPFGFQRYRGTKTMAPVTQVTPGDGFYVHTYYDVCPFSPSQRYLAATRLPYQKQIPKLGDTAEVCVIDLEKRTIRSVYKTKSWGFQTGGLAQWGATDRHLYTNDIVGDRAVCVRIDLETGETQAYGGPMYHIAPDASSVIGFPLELLDVTQRGYGVPAADHENPKMLPPGASKSEGVWKTDLESGQTKLLVSVADAAATVPMPPPESGGTYYFWHSKFNRQGTRIMQVLRHMLPSGRGKRNAMVLSFKPDGSDIRFAPQANLWGTDGLGGHPNWHPDGVHFLRVMVIGDVKRLCKYRYDDADYTVLSEKVLGGGHPSFEGTGRFITTDGFHGTRPQQVDIQLIDMQSEEIATLCTLPTMPRAPEIDYAPHRLDGHPVWSRDYRKICFQAAPEGKRQLFVTDVSELLG